MTAATLTGQVMMMFSSDSLVNITSPLDLDSLFYWFAADVGVTDSLGGAIATDEGVGTWNDLSGNGHHVTQSTNGARPVWKATGGPGSKPTVQFDGTDDFLASAAHWWGSDDLTVIVVMKNTTQAPGSTIKFIVGKNKTNTNKRQWQIYNNQGNTFLQTDSDGSVPSSQAYITSQPTIWFLHSIVSAPTTVTWWEDGASEAVTGSSENILDDNTTGIFIGARDAASPDLFSDMSISEVIVFSRPLTTGERTAIENYLNKKYDLY